MDGIKIGSLIGSKPENVPNWGAGIVRRLSRDDKNNMHIGVEVLSTQIVGISLTDRVQAADEDMQIALYLNRPADTSGEAWLLMRPDTFSPNRSLNMDMEGKGYLLLPLALVESGDDYDLARLSPHGAGSLGRVEFHSASLCVSHCSISRISSGHTECGMP